MKVFGMSNCSGCDTVKTLLTQNGVEFVYVDIMNPENMADAQARGIRSVPTTVINGEVIVGSQPAQIQAIRNAVGI